MTDTMERKSLSAGWLDGAGPGSAIRRGIVRGKADIEAIEAVTPDSVLPGATTYACLRRMAEASPEKTAILAMATSDPDGPLRAVSYAEYVAGATAAANLFRSGATGPVVTAMMMPIVPDALFAAWGGCTAGVITPINPHLEPEMVASILNRVGATTLVTTRAHGPSAADRLDAIKAAVPGLRNIWLVDGDDPKTDFARALSAQPSDRLTFEPSPDPHAPSLYLPTGGTTASPKLARLNHFGQLLNAWTAGAIMGSGADEVVGVGMPLFHVGGLLMLSLRSLVHGQTLLMLTPGGFRDPGVVARFWDISRRLGMTSVIATPTTAAALLSADNDHAGHRVRTLTCGGSTIPVDLGRRFKARFGLDLREVWGSTEFHGFLGCMPNAVEPVLGSVGLRIPFHDVRAFVLDGNRFVREAAPGEQGVIVGKGPCVCSGYVDPANDPDFVVVGAPDGAAWGSSGDLGCVDADGFIWIHGRAKDVIIRGGHNIDPRLIEEVLVTHPTVQLAAAIGRPDLSKGELPMAYVQLKPGASATSEELLEFCRASVQERAACPVEVVILDQMPLTAVGKIFKPKLRLDAMRRVAMDIAADVVGIDGVQSVETPDTKGRPRVVVKLTPSVLSDDGRVTRLRDALNGFAFEADVR